MSAKSGYSDATNPLQKLKIDESTGLVGAKKCHHNQRRKSYPVRNHGEAFSKTYSSLYFSMRRSIRNIGTENRARNLQAVRYSGRHSHLPRPPRKSNAS